ncbi:VIT1/CCC1 transporter family protein [Pseudactinotalea sp. Z1748]|uniref:VIT1/CCC1 transporter family protein n=1 Tax=Pseudactinotalea sp. Z1748 TaxID=3413027 RepID=UPI003C7BAE57
MSNSSSRKAQVRRWRRYLAEEQAEAKVYRALAQRRSGEEAQILNALAEAEARHAAHWEHLLADYPGRARGPSLRSRLLILLAGWFGSVFVLALAQRAESRSSYAEDADATDAMAADERIHAEVVRSLAVRGRARMSGSFRAAVFGMNDGLVSNLALVLGIGAAGTSTTVILLTGLSGLLAGALSMAAGEYVSVQSQRELVDASAPSPSAHTVIEHLDVNANELALIYRARGMSQEDAAARAAERLAVADPERQQPLRAGSTPVELGSALSAAVASFFLFAAGAIIPVLPYLFGATGTTAVLLAAVLVGLALVVTGATVGLLSGSSPWLRALRQLGIGWGAAAVTYALGLAFGALVG